MNSLNPKTLAQKLADTNPALVLGLLEEIMTVPGGESVSRKGVVALHALQDPRVYDGIVEAGMYGKCLSTLYRCGYTTFSKLQALSLGSSKRTNNDDILYCRSVGQIWRDAPDIYQQLYPSEYLSKETSNETCPIWVVGVLCRSLMVVKDRPKLFGSFSEDQVGEMAEVISSMERGLKDITSVLEATCQQLKEVAEISKSSAHNFLATLGWIYSCGGELPDLDFEVLDKLISHNSYQANPIEREAISFLKVKALREVADQHGATPNKAARPKF